VTNIGFFTYFTNGNGIVNLYHATPEELKRNKEMEDKIKMKHLPIICVFKNSSTDDLGNKSMPELCKKKNCPNGTFNMMPAHDEPFHNCLVPANKYIEEQTPIKRDSEIPPSRE